MALKIILDTCRVEIRVSAASAVRWVALKAETGGIGQRPRGGRSRSPLEPHAAWLLELNEAENDLTLAQIGERLKAERGVAITEASIRRFFKRRRISFKKNPARQRADAARRGRGSRPVEGEPGRA